MEQLNRRIPWFFAVVLIPSPPPPPASECRRACTCYTEVERLREKKGKGRELLSSVSADEREGGIRTQIRRKQKTLNLSHIFSLGVFCEFSHLKGWAGLCTGLLCTHRGGNNHHCCTFTQHENISPLVFIVLVFPCCGQQIYAQS